MKVIYTPMPIVEVEGDLVTMEVGFGSNEVQFGDEVSCRSKQRLYPSRFVQGVDTVIASQVASEVLALFGLRTVEELRESLSRAYGTGFGAHVPVTIYTLSDHPFFEDSTDV